MNVAVVGRVLRIEESTEDEVAVYNHCSKASGGYVLEDQLSWLVPVMKSHGVELETIGHQGSQDKLEIVESKVAPLKPKPPKNQIIKEYGDRIL